MKFHSLDLSAFSNQIKIEDKKSKVDKSGVSQLKLLQILISHSISMTAITALWDSTVFCGEKEHQGKMNKLYFRAFKTTIIL